MALSTPRQFYSIHSVSPYNFQNGNFYGSLRVLQNSSIGLTAETIKNTGGSSKFPWGVEVGDMTSEMSLSYSEFPDFVFELFGGNAPTANSAEENGSVTDLTNKSGSLVDATGLASVGIKSGSESDLKFGKYIVKAVDATTVDVYLSSDADIGRGTNGEYQNDSLKITESPLTITADTAVTVPSFGLELTGGSGTIEMSAGDTATFDVRPPNSGSMDVVIGSQASQSFPEFGAIIMGAKKGELDNQLVEIDAYRCKAAGLPLPFARNTWAIAETTVDLLYDSTRDGVYSLRTVSPTA